MINAYAATEAGARLESFAYDPGPMGHNDVEIEVEYCGICHSDLSMLDNEWGITEYPMILGQRSVSGSPVGSPANIAGMLDFAVRHAIKPVIETFPMARVNEAMDHLRSGKARYRIVLNR